MPLVRFPIVAWWYKGGNREDPLYFTYYYHYCCCFFDLELLPSNPSWEPAIVGLFNSTNLLAAKGIQSQWSKVLRRDHRPFFEGRKYIFFYITSCKFGGLYLMCFFPGTTLIENGVYKEHWFWKYLHTYSHFKQIFYTFILSIILQLPNQNPLLYIFKIGQENFKIVYYHKKREIRNPLFCYIPI